MKNDLADRFGPTAYAFRGYNLANLGRSDELLAHPKYGAIVRRRLEEAGNLCQEVAGRPIDLMARIRSRVEPDLATYDESVAIIVAMELAQIDLLKEFFGLDYARADMAFGYSLGELAALACSGALEMPGSLRVPLAMAADSAELARDAAMGVLFSRGPAIAFDDVTRLCLRVTVEGRGTIGVSSILSPNTLLLIGQGQTLARMKELLPESLPSGVQLRPNPHRWPPLHTPIMWQRNIPNRSAVMMSNMAGGFRTPQPKVISLVTGKASYNDFNLRDLLHRWVDHPQRLWDAVYATLSEGIATVIHVGPAPNLIPATFKRLSDNITEQLSGRSLGNLGLRAFSGLAGRQWLKMILPSRTALLRAPRLRHIILEDWLLEHAPTTAQARVLEAFPPTRSPSEDSRPPTRSVSEDEQPQPEASALNQSQPDSSLADASG